MQDGNGKQFQSYTARYGISNPANTSGSDNPLFLCAHTCHLFITSTAAQQLQRTGSPALLLLWPSQNLGDHQRVRTSAVGSACCAAPQALTRCPPLRSSFNHGLVHSVVLSNYIAFGPGTDQYNWFVNDLSVNLNRQQTPWVIVFWHAPVYAPYPACALICP